MAHFAKIYDGRVVAVVHGRDEDDGKEIELSERTGDTYKQTSYNTRGGVHYDPETGEPSADQSKALRYNYASVGYFYDEERDAFIEPKPYPSWTLDETTCLYQAPVPMPGDGQIYEWSENAQEWVVAPPEPE